MSGVGKEIRSCIAGRSSAFGQICFMLLLKNSVVLLLFGEVPEVECTYDVSRMKQDLPDACNNRVTVAASQWGIWMGDYCCFPCLEQVLVMLFWMVQATIQRCIIIQGRNCERIVRFWKTHRMAFNGYLASVSMQKESQKGGNKA